MEEQLKLSGVVYKVFDTVKVSDTFTKREFVIETEDKYPQKVKFELTQDSCKKIDNLKEGETVTVYFNVRGREWENKKKEQLVYFVSLNAWRVETSSIEKMPDTGKVVPATTGEDDLPF